MAKNKKTSKKAAKKEPIAPYKLTIGKTNGKEYRFTRVMLDTLDEVEDAVRASLKDESYDTGIRELVISFKRSTAPKEKEEKA